MISLSPSRLVKFIATGLALGLAPVAIAAAPGTSTAIGPDLAKAEVSEAAIATGTKSTATKSRVTVTLVNNSSSEVRLTRNPSSNSTALILRPRSSNTRFSDTPGTRLYFHGNRTPVVTLRPEMNGTSIVVAR